MSLFQLICFLLLIIYMDYKMYRMFSKAGWENKKMLPVMVLANLFFIAGCMLIVRLME